MHDRYHFPLTGILLIIYFFYRDTIVQAFKQQETSQDQRTQELARKSRNAKAAKSIPSLGGKPVMLLPSKVSTGSGKPLTSPVQSSKPMLSPQTQSTPSPLASMENMFNSQANQPAVMADGYPATSGMMPGGLAQHGGQHMSSSTASYTRHMGLQTGQLIAQGEMLSPTQTDLQQQMSSPAMLGHTGMPMPDMSEPPPPYRQQQFGQQQPPDLQQQQQYYHHQQIHNRQQYPYQQQYGQHGQNTYEQVSDFCSRLKSDQLKAVAGFFAMYHRVATAQGKQGIWLLTFPDRENTGNLVNFIFYTWKIVPTQGKF